MDELQPYIESYLVKFGQIAPQPGNAALNPQMLTPLFLPPRLQKKKRTHMCILMEHPLPPLSPLPLVKK